MIASAVLSLPEAIKRAEKAAGAGVARKAVGYKYELWQRSGPTGAIPKPRGTLRLTLGWVPVDTTQVSRR